MARVVVIGSSNTDMTVRLPALPGPGQTVLGGSFLSGPGGKGANQAVAARRAGAEVVFVTAVGDDQLGRDALELYRREGIDVSYARVVPGAASGVALILVGEGGENMIGVAPGANALLTPEDIDRLPDSVFARGGVLLASLEVPLATVVRGLQRAKGAGMITVLNPAPVPLGLVWDPKAGVEPPLALVDVLTPNRSELQALFGESSDLNPGFGELALVLTEGAEGCRVIESRRRIVRIPARPVAAVDTVGAGDAFNGALAVALAEGRLIIEAALWATDAAALSVTRRGAQEGLPNREEIDRLAAQPRKPPPPHYEDRA